MTVLLAVLAFGFAGASLYRVVTIWSALPEHVADRRRPGQPEQLLVQVFRYLLLIGTAWIGAGLVLLGDALAAASGAPELVGVPRLVVLLGVALLALSLVLMLTVRVFGWPRHVVPPTVRRQSER